MESWLSVPEKSDGNRKKKRFEWKKQLVIVSSRKIFFYNTEKEKNDATPSMIIDIRYVPTFLFFYFLILFVVSFKQDCVGKEVVNFFGLDKRLVGRKFFDEIITFGIKQAFCWIKLTRNNIKFFLFTNTVNCTT